jgi:3(or 17)beta-hydroxysteroid dehydrogenase
VRVAGKVTIVTGAGSGIGKGIAQLMAQEGAKVTLLDCDQRSGQQTLHEIHQTGGDAFFCPADVSSSADWQNAIKATVDRYGRVDVLVNNAAVQVLAKLVETSDEVWDWIHDVNLKGVFLGCKYAIPAMLKTGGGRW